LAQKVRNAHSAGRTGAASSATPRGGHLPRHHHVKRGRFCRRPGPQRTAHATKKQPFVYLCTKGRAHCIAHHPLANANVQSVEENTAVGAKNQSAEAEGASVFAIALDPIRVRSVAARMNGGHTKRSSALCVVRKNSARS
jgi:hypothetical protein